MNGGIVLLAGKNGDQLKLDLLGYEFPTIEDDESDSNRHGRRGQIGSAEPRQTWP